MLIKDLDGQSHNWHLTGNMAHGKIDNRSSLHLAAREIITECFPTLQILEEIPIHLKKGTILYLDFYLPLKKTCIEIHGEQHYKFIRFYHNDILGFKKSQRRDREKQEWCLINGISFIELPYNEKIEEWTRRIKND